MAEGPKSKGPGLLEQDGAESVQKCANSQHGEMIPQARQAVKRANWLRDFHVQSGMKSAEIVELIRPSFPGFDKSLLAKCENPEKYGVQLSRKAMNLLKGAKKHD